MGAVFDKIDPSLRDVIEKQHVFFVATAPSGREGHVNLSPKGLDSLRVIDDRTVAYLDFVGSGAETIAHLRENGRITLMFCTFEGPPKIVRLYGRGETIEPLDTRFTELRALFPEMKGVRSVIVIHVYRASSSCGYSVPLYEYQGERTQLEAWAERKGEAALERYQRDNNAKSIDGLPALRWVDETAT